MSTASLATAVQDFEFFVKTMNGYTLCTLYLKWAETNFVVVKLYAKD